MNSKRRTVLLKLSLFLQKTFAKQGNSCLKQASIVLLFTNKYIDY